MSILNVRHCLLAACAGLLVVAACSQNAPTTPSSPGASGAVVEGTVVGMGSSRTSSSGSLATQASSSGSNGLTVRVIGTDVSAAVGSGGAFRLSGVPAGTVQIQFKNASIDATTQLADVTDGDVIQIQVEVSASSAVVVNDERAGKITLCHTEGNGTYHSISVSLDAEATHRAHGDGKVGEPVPGQTGKTFGEGCRVEGASVDIEKSTNGEDADSAPGPSITVGQPVNWAYHVTNTGTIPLTGIVVSDDRGVVVSCAGQTTLAIGAAMTCTGAGVATLGQYSNIGTVSASWASATGSGVVSDSDPSHYLGVVPVEGEEAKVSLCHKQGNGVYHLISVSLSAEPAHRAHGDAKVGEAVPASPGKTFNSSCGLQ